MNYAQKYDIFFPFFIKVVVNKSQAYSFLIIGMMQLQKILLSVIMLRFHFFTTKQGTWVHKNDRGPLFWLMWLVQSVFERAIVVGRLTVWCLGNPTQILTCELMWNYFRSESGVKFFIHEIVLNFLSLACSTLFHMWNS